MITCDHVIDLQSRVEFVQLKLEFHFDREPYTAP